jgi:hypothetical protein
VQVACLCSICCLHLWVRACLLTACGCQAARCTALLVSICYVLSCQAGHVGFSAVHSALAQVECSAIVSLVHPCSRAVHLVCQLLACQSLCWIALSAWVRCAPEGSNRMSVQWRHPVAMVVGNGGWQWWVAMVGGNGGWQWWLW